MPHYDGDLTQRPIPQLIRHIAVPASVGIFFHTMFNVVDTYFAGHISTQALAALSLSFPAFFLLISLGSGLQTGTTALIGNALGAADHEKAGRLALQGLVFGVLTGAVLTLVGLAVGPWLFRSLGAEGHYLDLAVRYMDTIFLGSVAFLLVYMNNAILQAHGDTRPFRNFLIAGFVANCLLDPWFIFGGLGLPALGIRGVALATVLIQAGGAVYLAHKARQTGLVRMRSWRDLLPQIQPVAAIARQGFPSSVNFMTIGLGIYVITYFVSDFGPQAVAAYGAAMRVEQIALLPSIGLNIATLSLVAQNRGRRHHDRIWNTLGTALQYGAVVMALGTLGVLVLARPLMTLFTEDPAVVDIGTTYLRIDALVFFAYVILFVHVAALQGVKRPMFGVWIGLGRQIIAPLIVFGLLVKWLGMGLIGIWWGIFGITWAAALIAAISGRRYLARVLTQEEHDG